MLSEGEGEGEKDEGGVVGGGGGGGGGVHGKPGTPEQPENKTGINCQTGNESRLDPNPKLTLT